MKPSYCSTKTGYLLLFLVMFTFSSLGQPPIKRSAQWKHGQSLFVRCTSCHTIFKDMTGPALGNVETRGPWTDRKNLYAFIRNPAQFMATNEYAKAQKNKYQALMVPFLLSDSEMNDILFYINQETTDRETLLLILRGLRRIESTLRSSKE